MCSIPMAAAAVMAPLLHLAVTCSSSGAAMGFFPLINIDFIHTQGLRQDFLARCILFLGADTDISNFQKIRPRPK